MNKAIQDVYLLDALKLHAKVCLCHQEGGYFEALQQLRLDLGKALAAQASVSPEDRVAMDTVNLLYKDAQDAVEFAQRSGLTAPPKEV